MLLKNRPQSTALVISVAIHLLLLLLYRPLAKVDIFPGGEEEGAVEAAPIVFELVETPDDADRQRPDDANLLSDKNALARNETRPDGLESGDAYSEGISEYRVFEGRPRSDGVRSGDESDGLREGSKDGQDRPDERLEDSRDRPGKASEDREEEFVGPEYPLAPSESTRRRESGDDSPESVSNGSSSSSFTDDASFDQREFASRNLGGISLNTYEWDFASYILEMKRKIKSNTWPPGAFSQLGLISGRTVIGFKVLKDGTVAGLNVIDYRGHETLMETSVDAVRDSSPFRPLPADFPEEYLELQWTFIYRVYR